MIFNSADKKEAKAARNRLYYLLSKKRTVEIIEKSPGRTLAQNNYLHLLIGAFALESDYSFEESKLLYKKVNKTLYFYTKNNVQFMRSSADLDKKEMAESIDRFMDWAATAGILLPAATDQDWLNSITNRMEKERRRL